MKIKILLVSFCLIMVSCNTKEKITGQKVKDMEITDEQQDYLGITDKAHLSAASKRALNWPKEATNDWYFEYQIQDLKGADRKSVV